MLSRVNPDDDAGPSRLAVAPGYGAIAPPIILDPRSLVQPQSIGSVNVKNSKEVTFGTKILNITVDNREKVTGHLLGLEFVSETNRSRTIRCSCAVLACCIIIVAFGILIFIVHTTLRDHTNRIDLGINDTWYLRRDDWQAVDPKAIDFLKIPVAYAVLGHTVTPKCKQRIECIKEVRAIQKFHIFNRRWDDIGLNFFVGGGGLIFEGRGSNVQSAFIHKWNDKIISIGFLGDYRSGHDEPEDVQIEHVERLLERLVELQVLIPDYWLLGKCQITGDTSPGALMNVRLKDFSHWNSANFSKCPPD